MNKTYRFDKRAHCLFRRMAEAPKHLRELRDDCTIVISNASNPRQIEALKRQLDDIENLLGKAERAFSALTLGGECAYN